ncbi:unnamed protein product, partial [Effrenium voratum]
ATTRGLCGAPASGQHIVAHFGGLWSADAVASFLGAANHVGAGGRPHLESLWAGGHSQAGREPVAGSSPLQRGVGRGRSKVYSCALAPALCGVLAPRGFSAADLPWART